MTEDDASTVSREVLESGDELWNTYVDYCCDMVFWNHIQARELRIRMENWFNPEVFCSPEYIVDTRRVTADEAAYWSSLQECNPLVKTLITSNRYLWPAQLTQLPQMTYTAECICTAL